MIRFLQIVFAVIIVARSFNCFSQTDGLYIPINFQKAYNMKTRSMDGNPGMVYWQNRANYNINVQLDPKTRQVSGTETISYFNNSSDTIKKIFFHLFPNLYKKGNARDVDIDTEDENEGVVISRIEVNGYEVNQPDRSKQITSFHSGFSLRLKEPLLPLNQLRVNITWRYTENSKSHIRSGQVDSTTYFVAYFFPRIAVYDDIDGWNSFSYTGTTEFYNDFGNFDVAITVPQNYLVWATGQLKNPEEVLTDKYYRRFQAAFNSNVLIRIIDTLDISQKNITQPNEFNTWKYSAENITDFAFGTSNHYLWDAQGMVVDKEKNKKILIDAAYNPKSGDFYNVVRYAQQAINFMCNTFPGIPFPYPKITIFNGLSEMEYPMIVNDKSYANNQHEAFLLTAHEIFHSYFPFYTGLNESKYAWMDEGLTTFTTYLIVNALDSLNKDNITFFNDYKPYMGKDLDIPLFTNSKYIKSPVYDFISYPKAALFLLVLRDALGDKVFNLSIREFISRWNGKHPTPYDLFYTIYSITNQNLDWLIKPWVFEMGYVDLAIKDLTISEGKYKIIVERAGRYPSPVKIKVHFSDGSFDNIYNSVNVWKDGRKELIIERNDPRKIKKVEILNDLQMDVYPQNNFFNPNIRKSKLSN